VNQTSLFDAPLSAESPAAPASDPAAWRDVPAPPGAPAVPYRVRLDHRAAEWWCEKTGEWRSLGAWARVQVVAAADFTAVNPRL
jgi:hypothetical protein